MMRVLSAIVGWGILAGGLLALSLTPVRADEDGKWVTVKGHVVFGGDTLSPVKQIDVNKDKEHCLSRGPIESEEWVIDPKNKGVRWAFVWLAPVPDAENPAKKLKMPIHPSLKAIKNKEVVLDQPCCRFEPHALALREGQVLVAKNSAPIVHNVHWIGGPDNPGNNVIIPPGAKVVIDDLKMSRYPVSFKCDIHGWMQSWVRVFDHPYYAVTDENGNFEFKNAPVGDYQLVVWHDAIGYRDIKRVEFDGKKIAIYGTKITIKPSEVNDVGAFDLKPKKD